jgi:hypothetical protein
MSSATQWRGNAVKFLTKVFLPWAKTNLRFWENYHYISPVIAKRFGKLSFAEIDTQMVDAFKADLRNSITKRGTRRSEADTNHFLDAQSGFHAGN